MVQEQAFGMKVVLIAPNYLIRDDFGDPTDPPIGIASIAAVLLEIGHDVLVIDANAENLSEDSVLDRVCEFEPDAVGISCNYSPLHNPTQSIASLVRQACGCPVIVGGNHASALAEYILGSMKDVDYVVRGEGEVILPLLLESLTGKRVVKDVPGITFRSPQGLVTTAEAPLAADLDAFPIPAYHLLPMHIYKRYNIVASRGCPFECAYCASNTIFKRKVRYRSPESVVSEIEHLIANFGRRHFWFSDDTFTSNATYTHKLLDEINLRKLEITWSCLTRVNRVDETLLLKMKESGCQYVSYGIESGSEKMLNEMGKKVGVDDILRAVEVTHRVGLRQYGFFIVGFPGESRETILDSYRLIFNSKLDGAAFNILIPLPGTRVMKYLLDKGLLSLDEMEWDYLFARTVTESYEKYAADLAERWTELSSRELLDACTVGNQLPEIFRYLLSSDKAQA